MGKKNKDDAPNLNSVPNRDIIQRLNFLYQASSYLNGIGAVHTQAGLPIVSALPVKENGPSVEPEAFTSLGDEMNKASDGSGEKSSQGISMREPPGKRKATVHDLARSYVKSMKIIGQKTNVKMDPSVKRTMCKGCNTLLMPGVTARVRVKSLPSHGHAVNYTCMHCSFSRRIPAPPTTNQTAQSSSAQLSGESAKSTLSTGVDLAAALLDTMKAEGSVGSAMDVKQLQRRGQKRKKKPIKPHPLPFFARVEHITFIGNDRVNRNLEGSELDREQRGTD